MASIDEPGGDYISVAIHRNGILVYKRDAVLTATQGNGNVRVYKVDDTDTFNSNKNDTVQDIATRLLKQKGNR